MPYEIPPANPGQVLEVEPPELVGMTHSSYMDVLELIHNIVKHHKGLKVLAADDQKWVRAGFRLEYPNGEVDWICVRMKDADRLAFRYKGTRSALAYALERGEAPEEALDLVESAPSFKGNEDGWDDLDGSKMMGAIIAKKREEGQSRSPV